MLLLLMMVAGVTSTLAQNVTISAQNGSLICSDADGLGTDGGAFSMWRHEQLALTMIASNRTELTDDGVLRYHKNWFNTCNNCTFRSNISDADKKKYIDCGWQRTGYYTISLPKGYRFTGYRIEMSRDITDTGQGFDINTTTSVTMRETDSEFNNVNGHPYVTLPGVPASASDVQVFTLTRTDNDMGNILYFKATNSNNNNDMYDLTLRYVELTFAADADTPIDIVPNTQVTNGRSLLAVPFNTGKVDLGEVTGRAAGSGNRISYSLNNFKDMTANMLLYEYGSTEEGTGFDGTSGLIAVNRTGSITTSGNYFRFAPDKITDTNKPNEVKYVLETPVSAVQAGNIENPVQFRITGATINYKFNGEEEFYIIAEINGTTYYLGTNGTFTTNQVAWKQDDQGRIHNGNSYLQGTEGLISTGSANNGNVYTITDGIISITSGYYNPTTRYLKYRQYYGSNTIYGYLSNSDSYTNATIEPIESTDASNAIIYIYDKEGNRDSRYPNGITVSSSGDVDIPDLNNDAIIFGVRGGDVALLNFEVKLQALNPYIDQMTVVLNVTKQDGSKVRMTRPFTSDDFSVGGDKFEFYLPSELKNRPVDMTFEDLYSKYGDETYDHISGTEHSSSRYNYVMSQHHQKFTNDNIYNDPDDEAKSGTLESVRLAADEGKGVNVRTKVGTVGDQPFIFNNADELSTDEGYLREFPFTVNNYATQSTNPNLRVKPENGDFIAALFAADDVHEQGTDKDFYVFTTDETRYNIAPTTATQHRAYAYYKMAVRVQVATYDPIVTFVPIYTNAFYQDANGTNTTGNFYGARITAPSSITTPIASDVAINKAIQNKILENKPADITGADAINAYVAAEMKKILYLDASPLTGVYHTSPTTTADEAYAVESFNALKDKFAPNALVFLPANATDKYNNFAYAKKGEVLSFQSANNIILTDKNPFYSPYDIQVDAANYAIYTRQTTKSTYSGEEYATVIMPFTIKFDTGSEGVKTDADYGTLKFLQMNTTAAASDDYNFMGKTLFFSPAQGTQVEANTPYALHVEENKASDCFTLRQYGSNIIATPAAAKSGNSLFSATEITSTGNLTGKDNVKHTYTFSHKGSFSGHKVPRDPVTFYFANNGFYSSADLKSTYTTVDLFPFRAVYEVTGDNPNANAKVGFMHIFEGENNTTGIVDINKDNNYSGIATGEGTITITADAAGTYRIFSAAGQNASNVTLRAGETKTVNVPAGVYVVNGVKVLVK